MILKRLILLLSIISVSIFAHNDLKVIPLKAPGHGVAYPYGCFVPSVVGKLLPVRMRGRHLTLEDLLRRARYAQAGFVRLCPQGDTHECMDIRPDNGHRLTEYWIVKNAHATHPMGQPQHLPAALIEKTLSDTFTAYWMDYVFAPTHTMTHLDIVHSDSDRLTYEMQ